MPVTRVPNIKKLRNDRKLTQKQLGEALGITNRTIIRWEQGEGEPGIADLLILARFFGVSIDQLIGELLPEDDFGALPKMSDLSGRDLDFWVARAQGHAPEVIDGEPVVLVPGGTPRAVLAYSSNWSYAGPIVSEYEMHFTPMPSGIPFDGVLRMEKGVIARPAAHPTAAWGRNHLEAAMRAYLIAAFGERIMT
ncbi:helix-turn-helix domain-containing protein [Variovorax sp. PDNC026]|uniref:helix-turn-helix domain-containing protein n=1 Tax=Variovorax sp. PDNC026 TaxID=2811425 RepID=UPI001965FDAE|nr:helix-turn-helix domain-containing protein [Variovorax sp. PDNC026]QRY31159.1 helix-turn-helix domain-containing protein [Variovorax sp. PDNC026]